MYNFDSILTEDDLSLLSCEDHSDNVNLNKEMLCPECWRLPIIKIDSSKHIITSDCNFNHHCILDLNQFIKKSSNHSLYDISCSICQKNQNKSKVIYQYCLECNNFLCNLCSQNHDTQKQNKNHHLISIDKLNSYCILHKNKYNSYCETCSKNICGKCKNLHEKHKIINFEAVFPSKEEIKQKRNMLSKQREEITKLEMCFKEIMQQIVNKFHEAIENELKQIELQEAIVSKVDNSPSNYYHILNFIELPKTFREFNKPKIGSGIQKLKKIFYYLNEEETTDMPEITIKPMIKIKSIVEHKKEIMNMVKLRNGGFATSSWDGTVKIFDDQNYNLIQTIKEPKLNDISYVTQLSDDSLLICSNIMQKIRLSNDNKSHTIEFIFNDYKDYIIKVIELENKNIITCDWEFKIKVWGLSKNNNNNSNINNSNSNITIGNTVGNTSTAGNPNTIGNNINSIAGKASKRLSLKKGNNSGFFKNNNLYYIIKDSINQGEHLSSICRINDNQFVSSSNSHLEKGKDLLRFYDQNLVNYDTIKGISCSELPDSICQLNKKLLAVALQRWKEGQVRGIALINVNFRQIVKIIQTDAITYINLLSNGLVITGGREVNTKRSIVKIWCLEGVEMNLLSENCSEQKDAITCVIELNDGILACSSYDASIAILK
jgi:hypothetical protein